MPGPLYSLNSKGGGMSEYNTSESPTGSTGGAAQLDSMWQVILFNDEHNEASYVVHCLKKVFGHVEPLARKIMMEAHRRGRAIAEVEEREKALLHKTQLQTFGLTTAVEPI